MDCDLPAYRAYRRDAMRSREQGRPPPPRDYALEKSCYKNRPGPRQKDRLRNRIRYWAVKRGIVQRNDGTHIHSPDHHASHRGLVALPAHLHRDIHSQEAKARARTHTANNPTPGKPRSAHPRVD